MMAPGAMPEAGQLAMVACRTSWHLSNCIQGLVHSPFVMHCFVLCCSSGQQFCLRELFRCASCQYAVSIGSGIGDWYSFKPNCRCNIGDKLHCERAIGCYKLQPHLADMAGAAGHTEVLLSTMAMGSSTMEAFEFPQMILSKLFWVA